MTRADDPHAETKERIGDLLDEALALADHIRVPVLAAQIAQALHTLDPDRRIACPPTGDFALRELCQRSPGAADWQRDTEHPGRSMS